MFKQKTAYEMRISDWSSDVCSSDLALVTGIGRTVDAGDRADERAVSGVDLLQRVGDLADRGAAARRLDRQLQQVAGAGAGRFGQGVEGGAAGRTVTGFAEPRPAGDLRLADGRVVDRKDITVPTPRR